MHLQIQQPGTANRGRVEHEGSAGRKVATTGQRPLNRSRKRWLLARGSASSFFFASWQGTVGTRVPRPRPHLWSIDCLQPLTAATGRSAMARDSTEVDRAVRHERKLCNTRQVGGWGKAKQRQDVSVCAHAFLQPP
jgi:hypothetical protein